MPMAEVPTDTFSSVEREYMPTILEKIYQRASEIADQSNHEKANYVGIFRAFEQEFSGTTGSPSYIIRENIFLIIVVLMTIIFGIMGLAPFLWGDPTKVGYKPEVFLDIAKLFAGVVVGGAAGVAASATARRSRG
jgi:hypothetical protein